MSKQMSPMVFFRGENATQSKTPLMPVVQIREDMDPCALPLIYKWANTSPPELEFLNTREHRQVWLVPNHLRVACKMVREWGHFSCSTTCCTVWITSHPVSLLGRETPEESGSPFQMCETLHAHESAVLPACLWREPICLGCYVFTSPLKSLRWAVQTVFRALPVTLTCMIPRVNCSSENYTEITPIG